MNKEVIERLEDLIKQQPKGKDSILVNVDDVNELGYGIDNNKKGKVYVDVNYLKIALKRYKFKGELKVETKPKPEKTYKELLEEIKQIENRKVHESWDSISK